MQGWSSNGGPEAFVRLADGRFLVLAEMRDGWFSSGGPALLFPSDPVEGAQPVRFRYDAPPGTQPTDMAQLPDGRVLILHREVVLGVPPRFAATIVLADPKQIRAGQVWSGKVIARIASPLPSDNFEGLAIEPLAHGGARVWVISDDNQISFQRTILLKLRWAPPPPPKKKTSPNAPAETSGKQVREKGAR